MSRSHDPTSAKLIGLDRRTRQRVVFLVNYVRGVGVPLIVISGRRTAAQQRELIAAGKTTAVKSRHLIGQAVDVQVQGLLRDQVPLAWWQWIGSVGEHFGLVWGGRFKRPDLNHFQAR